jgi:hypothetical protein
LDRQPVALPERGGGYSARLNPTHTLIGASPTGLQGQTPERAVRPLATRRQSQHGYGPLREHILDFPKADKPKLAVDPSSIGAVRTSSAVPSWLTLL